MPDAPASLIPNALVPSGIRDPRHLALAQTFGEALAGIDPTALKMVDPMTVDARLLPYLVKEFAAGEYVAPDLPERVQRRILSNIWDLKALHGYDAGVRLGLSLLGMQMRIKHWHQEQPPQAPNTHEITFLVGEVFFGEDQVLGPRMIEAALRMIAVTKRHSQDSTVRIGANMTKRLAVRNASTRIEVVRRRAAMSRPTAFKKALAVACAAAPVSLSRSMAAAKRPSELFSKVSVRADVAVLQCNRFTAKAA